MGFFPCHYVQPSLLSSFLCGSPVGRTEYIKPIPIDLKKSQIMTTEYYIRGSQHHLACLPLSLAVARVPLAHLCWSFSLWPDISSGALKSLPVCARHNIMRPLKSH